MQLKICYALKKLPQVLICQRQQSKLFESVLSIRHASYSQESTLSVLMRHASSEESTLSSYASSEESTL